MKILVLNGSPRKGNTLTAITAFAKGVSNKHELEVVLLQYVIEITYI